MTMLFDDSRESGAMALHGARKQAQAGAERSQDDADRRNGELMRKDARLVRLLKDFSALADDQREAFVDVALTSWKAANP